MLDSALASTPEIVHLRFDRRRALFGRYDVFHFHWPETLLGGSTRIRVAMRRAFFALLLARLRLSRKIAVVRTVHNIELPQDVTPWERKMLMRVVARADFLILLNDQTPVDESARSTVIPHGDFRRWFEMVGASRASETADLVGFVGLIRRYKGVEGLIAAFRESKPVAQSMRLRIAGRPTSEDLAAEIRVLAGDDPRIELDLRYLSESEFVSAVTLTEGVVLPYRFMHNSGTVLAVLSLDRPVLVPRTPVNESLADEVGPGWIRMFEGELRSADLVSFLPTVRAERKSATPDLSGRTWEEVGTRHAAAYRSAASTRRRGAR
jgi:glycosyltransferase involved in cell wall biosynthesis